MSYQRGGENINQHNSKVKDTQRKFGVLEWNDYDGDGINNVIIQEGKVHQFNGETLKDTD
jgi:hypothetical protein